MDRLLLPLLGVRPASLISDETRVAFDAHLASSLASVHNKNSPQRFEAPTRDRPHRRHEGVFTDEFLDTFFRSLDPVLMPAVGLGADLLQSYFFSRPVRSFWAWPS
jgi:hypothetical protein